MDWILDNLKGIINFHRYDDDTMVMLGYVLVLGDEC